MIVLLGASGAGKDTLVKYLVKNYDFKKMVTYTTRPPRPDEKNGIDYYFTNDDEFEKMKSNDAFIETSVYRGWKYGSAKKSYLNAKGNDIVILTPSGLRDIKRFYQEQGIDYKKKITSVYLNVSRRERLKRLLNRGDDIEEAYRRNLSDIGQFDGIEKEVDIVIPSFSNKKDLADFFIDSIVDYRDDRDNEYNDNAFQIGDIVYTDLNNFIYKELLGIDIKD